MEVYETSSVKIEVDLSVDDGRMKIITQTEVKDSEVFPELNLEDKRIVAQILDVIAVQQQKLLNERTFWKNQPQRQVGNKVLRITCQKCGKPFDWPVPCCDKKQFDTTCPHCGLKKTWYKDKKKGQNVKGKKSGG